MIRKLKGNIEKRGDVFEGIASTEYKDRDGEVIKQDGWILENFKKNPVILASHNYQEFPIGKAIGVKVHEGKLKFKMMLTSATERGKEAIQLVKEGILKSFSVGFIPRERDEEDQKTITKAELLEISLVSVPANPEAVVTAKGLKDNKLAQSIMEHYLVDNTTTSKDKGDVKANGKAGGQRLSKVDAKNQKRLQMATGILQQVCRDMKEGGADK